MQGVIKGIQKGSDPKKGSGSHQVQLTAYRDQGSISSGSDMRLWLGHVGAVACVVARAVPKLKGDSRATH